MHMQPHSKIVQPNDSAPFGIADSLPELNIELHQHTPCPYLPSLVQLSAEIHDWNCHACKDNELCSVHEYSWESLLKESAIRLH